MKNHNGDPSLCQWCQSLNCELGLTIIHNSIFDTTDSWEAKFRSLRSTLRF